MTDEEFSFRLLKGLDGSDLDEMLIRGYIRIEELDIGVGVIMYGVLKEFIYNNRYCKPGGTIYD